jgi:hypothetical protein
MTVFFQNTGVDYDPAEGFLSYAFREKVITLGNFMLQAPH